MRAIQRQIVFQEIPNEISLSYLVAGCPWRCPGCHSADSWNVQAGQLVTADSFLKDLEHFKKWITCVLFLGGEWVSVDLIPLLILARQQGFKTALYTGLETVPDEIQMHLDFLKTGPYIQSLGGLSSPGTNQKLIHLRTGEVLNYYFHQKQGGRNDQTERKASSR